MGKEPSEASAGQAWELYLRTVIFYEVLTPLQIGKVMENSCLVWDMSNLA